MSTNPVLPAAPPAAPPAAGGWGSGAGTTDQTRASAKFVLQQAPAYPCLDVLYPGKFRFHCQRCTDDSVISKFTRHKFYLFFGFTEAGGEKLYRMPQAIANSYVEGCARGKFRAGACIAVTEGGIVVPAGAPLSAEELQVQEHSDDVSSLCNYVVRDQFELFTEGMQAHVLQSRRVPPYLLLVHENSSPSATDVKAFENNYSLEFLQKLDADYDEALQKSFRK